MGLRSWEVRSLELIQVQELTDMGESRGDPTGLRVERHGRSNHETQGAPTTQCGGPGDKVGHVQGDGSIELISAQHTV